MNTPVSFKLAKLLKEERFNEPIKQRYFIAENIDSDRFPFLQKECALYNWNNYDDFSTSYYSAPTIAEVIMWLYEKHGIWIEVRHIKTFNVNRFYVIVWNYKDTSDYMTIHCENGVGYEVWDSPTEAYEAAIKYCLEKY